MLTLDYKLAGTAAQYAAIDEGIRVTQFLRNTCVRAWMDRTDEGKAFATMSAYTAVLAKEFAFAAKLGSQARQAAAAERAWKAVQRFYDNCKKQIPGKKGYPRFKHDSRSIEYKVAGWTLESDGKHIIFTDGLGIGRVRLIGTRSIETFPLAQIKRVRLIRRADGYYCQTKNDLIVAFLMKSDEDFWDFFERSTRDATSARAKLCAFFEALQAYVISPTCYGCPFINIVSEYPEVGYAGHQVALTHKRAVHDRFAQLAKEAGARQPEELASALNLLMDGAYMAARMYGSLPDNPAATVREAAQSLIDAHCAHE